MPIYGDDKKRNMARSVLPSTARKSARTDKRNAHKTTRSRVRDALAHTFVDPCDPWMEWEEHPEIHLDAQRYDAYRGIKSVVFDRRGADKVRPLMRWAEAKADDLGDTPQERYKALRAMLPPNIIGWHAMTHVEALDEYEREPRLRWWWNWEERRRRDAREYDDKHSRLVAALTGLTDHNGGHKGLNRRLKENGSRCWGGIHDIEDFTEFILRQSRDWERRGLTGGGNGYGWDFYPKGARQIVAEFFGFEETF